MLNVISSIPVTIFNHITKMLNEVVQKLRTEKRFSDTGFTLDQNDTRFHLWFFCRQLESVGLFLRKGRWFIVGEQDLVKAVYPFKFNRQITGMKVSPCC